MSFNCRAVGWCGCDSAGARDGEKEPRRARNIAALRQVHRERPSYVEAAERARADLVKSMTALGVLR